MVYTWHISGIYPKNPHVIWQVYAWYIPLIWHWRIPDVYQVIWYTTIWYIPVIWYTMSFDRYIPGHMIYTCHMIYNVIWQVYTWYRSDIRQISSYRWHIPGTYQTYTSRINFSRVFICSPMSRHTSAVQVGLRFRLRVLPAGFNTAPSGSSSLMQQPEYNGGCVPHLNLKHFTWDPDQIRDRKTARWTTVPRQVLFPR